MDALALLCTLHADGPATLRILRRSGCASLAALEELGAERLAELLELTPATARRLLREARGLRQRVEEELFDREEAPAAFAAAGAPARAAGAAAQPPVGPAGPAADLGTRDRELLERVLDTWRARDAGEATAWAGAREGARPDALAPAPHAAPPPPATVALVPGALDGLTEECCRRLVAAHVVDVAALLAAEPLALARDAELSFTLVQRLQFLARRAQPGARWPDPAARKFSAAERPEDPARPASGWEFELRPVRSSAEGNAPALGPDAGGPFA